MAKQNPTLDQVTALAPIDTEPTPMAMIAEAVRLDLDPAKLHALMDLQQRVESREAEKMFTTAMAACQAEMPTVIRDRENSHTRSRYASLEQVQFAIKGTYLKHGFAVSVSEAESTKPDMIRVKLVLRHTGGHAETYYREAPNDSKGAKGNAVKTDLQGAQSTVSYLARQMLLAIFGVTVADQDRDGNEHAEPITQEQVKQLHDLLVQTDSDIDKFMQWMQVDDLTLITQGVQYTKAMNAVKGKVKK